MLCVNSISLAIFFTCIVAATASPYEAATSITATKDASVATAGLDVLDGEKSFELEKRIDFLSDYAPRFHFNCLCYQITLQQMTSSVI